jgi:hypothetical protein
MKRIDFFLDDNQSTFLATLPGTVSEHLRRAVDEYVERKQSSKVSGSLSNKGVNHGQQ